MLELLHNLFLLPYTLLEFIFKYIISIVIWFCTYHLVTILWYQYDMPFKIENWKENWNKLRRQKKYQKQSEKDDIDWESGL